MKTEILTLDKSNIDMEKVRFAAEVLRKGGLVAFPTETVYGLGANALDSSAVLKIFEAKGRPSDNPLIVHISGKADVLPLTTSLPPAAPDLMERFWPGPLTLILPKAQYIPHEVTAGLDTVAVRMPSHPVALALIKEAGVPVVAPSSNTSGRPSTTEAAHVIEDLGGKIDVIIDAGPSNIGVESTVLDITGSPAVILRPGGVTLAQLEEVLGPVEVSPSLSPEKLKDLKPRSPGMKYTHYSPKANMLIVDGAIPDMVGRINQLAAQYSTQGKRVGILATDETRHSYSGWPVISMGTRQEPQTIAAGLFRALRDFDHSSVDLILAEAVSPEGIGLAIMNRMSRAAGHNIIQV